MTAVGEVSGRGSIRLSEFLAQRMSTLTPSGRGLEEPCNLDRLGAVSQSRAERGSGFAQAPATRVGVIGPRPRVVFSGPFGYPRRSL